MSVPFGWVPGGAGAWLADRLEGSHGANTDPATGEPHAALAATVPAGFDAVVRILHPFSRDRPERGSWADWQRISESPQWAAAPEIVTEAVSWADTAAALGRDLGPVPRAWELLGEPTPWGGGAASGDPDAGEGRDTDAAGWRYTAPGWGTLPTELFAGVLALLARHTATPSAGVAAVWEGYGGLVSAQGVGWFFAFPEPPAWVPRPLAVVGQRLLGRALSFRERRRRFGWCAALWGLVMPGVQQRAGTGRLSREAALGERLELPDRAYVCFAAGATDLADPGWPGRAPWVDASEGGEVQTPNLVWPEEREWVLVSEIDFDSTLIACTAECAAELLRTPWIEAQLIDRDTALF